MNRKHRLQALSDEQEQFVEDLGQSVAGWGLPRTTGRIYAYLLLCTEPAGLDRIANDLEVAKSGASVATRQLVQLGLARTLGQRRSRRLLFEALYDPEAILSARNAQTIDFLARLRQGAQVAPAGRPRQRLTEMASLLQDLTDDIPVLLQRIRERRKHD
jgi:DNA-binding transcriptional regulator GbsR (MarR family)